MTIHLFINPTSGNCKPDKLIRSAPKHWKTHLTDLNLTKGYIDQTIQQGDCVIIAGGDGTIHLILNYFYQLNKTEWVRFGIIPMGTGNDLARSLGVDKLSHQKLFELYENNNIATALPLWKINDTIFCNYVSIGFDAAVVADVDRWRQKLPKSRALNKLLYFLSGLKNLRYKLPRNEAKIVNSQPNNCTSIILSNIASYGGGNLLDIKQSEPTLNVFLVKSAGDVLRFGKKRFCKEKSSPAYSLEAASFNATHVQVDGEIQKAGQYDINLAGIAKFFSNK